MWCSSARRRRRRRCSAPRSAATRRPAGPTRGSCARPRWSTSTTSTPSTATSGRSSSSSAPTFPYNAKLCLNGHEYAKRQLAQDGIAFEALDNGILSCADPAAAAGDLRRPVGGEDRRPAAQVAAPCCRTRSPAADREAGYRYDISILQAEFSLTQVLDRPVPGRVFFEQVIRENLDLGRPDQVQLIFDRKINRTDPGPVPHPGAHRGRHPVAAHRLQAHAHQAVPQGRPGAAHRDHDQRHLRLRHRQAAEQPARSCARSALRPTDVCSTSNASATTACSPKTPSRPSTARSRQVANAPRACASPIRASNRSLHALVLFRLLANGFRCADLRNHLAALVGTRSRNRSRQGAITYQLRRLRLHGLLVPLLNPKFGELGPGQVGNALQPDKASPPNLYRAPSRHQKGLAHGLL